MNPKFSKNAVVILALVVVLAFGTARVFAAAFSNGSGVHAPTLSIDSRLSDDSGMETQTPEPTQVAGEDFSFTGKISAINGMVYTIGEMSVTVDANTKLDSGLMVGSEVKVEVVKLADGSLLAKEIESALDDEQENEIEHPGGDDHGSDTGEVDDHGTDLNKMDDHGTDFNQVDDHGTDINKVDDNGTDINKIDDHGTDAGKVDDRGSNSGKVDDHGGNSGKGQSKP